METNKSTLNKLLTITDEKLWHIYMKTLLILQAMIKTYYKITKTIFKTIYNRLIQTMSDIKYIYKLVYIKSTVFIYKKKYSLTIMIFKK